MRQIVPKQQFLVKYPSNKTFYQRLKHAAKFFCLNTSLHGYKFIALPRRILLERVIWIIICLLALVVSLTLLFIAWYNFQENPTILVTDSNHFPIWNYPFPAVVICDLNKISKERLLKFAKTITSPENATVLANDMRIISQLIGTLKKNITSTNYINIQRLLDQREINVYNLLSDLAPNCREMIQKCLWKNEEVNCEDFFERISCSMGYCCAFNYFAIEKVIISRSSNFKALRQPRRVTACGQHTALEIVINSEPDDYFATLYPTYGHRVMLLYPYHYPDWNIQTMFVETNSLNLISINPTITYSDEMEKVPIQTRQCLYTYERKLIYFTHYNFHNCMVECRMNITRKLCGCLPYYYVQHQADFKKLKICNLLDVTCLTDIENKIVSAIPGVDFTKINPSSSYEGERRECNCLPDCENTQYLAEMSSGVLSRKFSPNNANLYDGVKLKNHSVVRVFFNDLVGGRNRRYIKFNWHYLFAYYGGILGLFLGFSFVSGIEFIYFFTMKLISRKKPNSKILKDDLNLPPSVQKVQPLETLDPTFLKYFRESYKKNVHKRHISTFDYVN